MGNAANYASAGPTGWHTKLTYSKENQMPDDEASEIEEKQLKELKDLQKKLVIAEKKNLKNQKGLEELEQEILSSPVKMEVKDM